MKSLALLRDIVPAVKMNRPMKKMERAGGKVRWENLFSGDEVTALVSLAPKPKEDPYDFPPEPLSLLNWSKNHWEYRQYLGDLDEFELVHRKGRPQHLVQGSKQTGRYEGVQHSWRYNPEKRTLTPTGWDQWGPFYRFSTL
jgi:hypothetical protein